MISNKLTGAIVLSGLLGCAGASAHTLFIKPDTFYAAPGSEFLVRLIDGTFITSESRLNKSSIRSIAIFGPDAREKDLAGQDLMYNGKETLLEVSLDDPGTYVIAAATKARKIVLDAESFNFYLRYEGLTDEQRERAEFKETNGDVVERYSKFAKAIIQVGDAVSSDVSREIGFDVEIVPVTNPNSMNVGDTFRARILRDGQPLPGELVYATHEGHYSADEEGIFDEAVKVRSDAAGMIAFEISAAGKWYVRFIDLERLSDAEYWYSNILVALRVQEQQISYESKWATLTFEIRE